MRQVSIDSNRVSGLVYYLPKGRIRITGDFKSASGDGGDAAAKSGSPAGAKLLAGAPSSPSGGDSAEQKNFVVTIAADIEADPKARYYLKPVRNYFTMMTSSSALTRSICSVRETRLPKTKLRRSFQQLPS